MTHPGAAPDFVPTADGNQSDAQMGSGMAAVPRGLAEVARDYKRGAASPQDLFDAFIAARLWSPAPPKPGVHVLRFQGESVVPVFSSERELAKFMGRTKWFSTTGLDLLSLLPTGVTIGLDMASPHRLQLDPAAVRLEYALVLPRSRPESTGNEER